MREAKRKIETGLREHFGLYKWLLVLMDCGIVSIVFYDLLNFLIVLNNN